MPDLAIEEILDKAREIATTIIAEDSENTDREGKWPERGMRALQEAGLGGLVLSQDVGGLGQGLFGMVQVCEAIGEQCASTGICFGMHHVGAAVINAKATQTQKDNFLVPIAEGKHLTTLALSEPGTGAHFYVPLTKIKVSSPESYELWGTKHFISNGGHADSYVVSTAAIEEVAPFRFSCVVIPKETENMDWEGTWKGMGMRGNSSIRLNLKGTKIPKDNLLGEEGDQLWYIFQVVAPYFLMAMAGVYLGIGTAAFEEGKKHLLKRTYEHTHKRLADMPLFQHRLGHLWTKLEAARRVIYHAAYAYDMQDPQATLSIMASKTHIADVAVDLVNEVMTLMGGLAYANDSKLHRMLRDVRASHVMSPTTDILKLWIGRALLDQPLLAEE